MHVVAGRGDVALECCAAWGGGALLRHLVPLLILLCSGGCATAPDTAFELGNLSGHGRRVLLKGAEAQLCEMHLGRECETRPEWVGTAQPLLQQALVAELTDRGADVVTDPSAAADYILTVNLKDHFASPGLVAGRAAFLVLLIPVAIVAGGEGMGGGSYSGPFGPSASASLEDATSHEVVWEVLYTRGIADVRTSDGARETSRLLLKELPWSQ